MHFRVFTPFWDNMASVSALGGVGGGAGRPDRCPCVGPTSARVDLASPMNLYPYQAEGAHFLAQDLGSKGPDDDGKP